jgi:hypothetical protein
MGLGRIIGAQNRNQADTFDDFLGAFWHLLLDGAMLSIGQSLPSRP